MGEIQPNSQVPEYNEFKFRGAEVLRLLKVLDGACISSAGKLTLSGRISPKYHDRMCAILEELSLATAMLNRSARSTVNRLGEYTGKDTDKEGQRK